MGTQLPLPKKGAEPPPNLQPMTIVAKRLDQQMALGMEVGLGPGHIVLDGHPAPLPKNEAKPLIFCPFLLWPTAGCIKMPLGMEVSLRPGDFVLDGDPVPLPKKERSPKFSAHIYCGQTATWIKMPLGTEVGLGLCNIVLGGDPAPLP